MKKYLCLLLAFTSPLLFGAENGEEDGSDDKQVLNQLREWIATKRQVTVRERGGALSLSGELRTDYTVTNDLKNGVKNIGSHSLNPAIPGDKFGVAFNTLFDYRTDATWASVRLKYANKMGSDTGTSDKIGLDRCFIGFRMLEKEKFTIDAELGRRGLSYYFDSRLQFGSLMDGIVFKYNQSHDRFGDFYFYGGPFVVNMNKDQFAYAFEIGLLNAYNTGLYWKYSMIDWKTKDFQNPIQNHKYQFFVNQFILGYKAVPKFIGKVTTLYGSFLVNAAARRHEFLKNRLDNLAWYAGLSIGETRKKGDWAIDSNVQWVLPQAVPDFDFTGIGVGNTDVSLYYTKDKSGNLTATTRENAEGNENYVGWLFQFMYLMTDNMTVVQTFKISTSLDRLPTKFFFKQYQIAFAYAW